MRSPRELLFRAKQEAMNVRLYLAGAGHTADLPPAGPLAGLPDPAPAFARLRGSQFADSVVQLAEDVLARRFHLLTLDVRTPSEIDWQLDPTHPNRNQLAWRRRAPFRMVPYMDVDRFGDYKIIWELNRLQHLPLLAQAWRFSGNRKYLDDLARQLASWKSQNPLGAGINWASALEAAFRLLSFIWTWHFAASDLDAGTRRLLANCMEDHARFLEYNLSFYHSPNTHLLGESLALEAAGTLFPHFRHTARWKKLGRETLDQELHTQVLADGGYFERSSYYHVYALEMFLLHGILAGRRDDQFRERMHAMARYLAAVAGPSRRLPLIGDDDGGRLFHPYGQRDRFCGATLTLCGLILDQTEWIGSETEAAEIAAWWIGEAALGRTGTQAPAASAWFPNTGIAVMTSGETNIIVDAGTFAPGSGGHSHADTLSIVVSCGAEEILIDPATYTYILDPAARDFFRGTAAHNTVRIDQLDQAVPAGPFRWLDHPAVEIVQQSSNAERDVLAAVCRYRGFSHARAILFVKPALLLICDRIEGAGEHLVEHFWHPGLATTRETASRIRIGAGAWIMFSPAATIDVGEGGEFGWRSPGLGTKFPAPYIRVFERAQFPLTRWTAIDLAAPGELSADHYRRDSLLVPLTVNVLGNGCIKMVE